MPETWRATLIAEVDVAEDEAAYDAWLEEWGSRLTRMSEEMGCGCCVLMREVEGPDEVIAAIPLRIRSSSESIESKTRR